MSNKLIILLSLCFVLLGCANSAKESQMLCAKGLTKLDGVCVNQGVANYVACVRAQGAELSSDRKRALKAQVGAIGVSVSGASEFSSELSKKYSASDKVMMAIIERCNSFAGVRSINNEVESGNKVAFSDNNLFGAWKINANNYIGKLEIKDINGTMSGRIWFDKYKRWEQLSAVTIENNTISFHRSRQRYSAEYSDGKLIGSFYSSGRNYKWTAVR